MGTEKCSLFSSQSLVVYENGSGMYLEDPASAGEGLPTEAFARCIMAALTMTYVILLLIVSGVG